MRAVRGRTVTVEAVDGKAFRVNADGEVDGPVTSRTWTLLPHAWTSRVPAALPPSSATHRRRRPRGRSGEGRVRSFVVVM
ncbi:hypothetical protein [Georgenia sp. SUBG003]|uniref:hypothetical protein n=1 Tax=Georgenia sp. SUBG003 TaxID=1497974 RepID=UPI003AB194B5